MSNNREETFTDLNGIEWYSESGSPVWPSRLRSMPRCGWDPEYEVTKMLDELKELAAQTDPAAGAQSSFEKNLKSQRALGLANNLIAIVAGWAIDHQAGLVKDGLKSIAGMVPQVLREKFSGRLSSLDDHEHERRGGHPDLQFDHIETRELLRNLLNINPGAYPVNLVGEVVLEIDKIAFGETSPTFQPAKNSNKKTYYSVQLEAWAAVMVAYRMEMGATWEDATHVVAEAFHKGFDTIKGWESNAKEKFGSLEIEIMKNLARNAARLELAEQRAALNQSPMARPGLYGRPYDDKALEELVAAYNASR
jgi:hypothetical protein